MPSRGAAELLFVFPSWVPGSYHIVPYVQNVRDLGAVRTDTGESIPAVRREKDRWAVATQGAEVVEVRYRVYGHDLVTEALDVAPEHFFVNAALCVPFVDGRRGEPIDVLLHLPPGWKVFTELESVGSSPPRFRARDYDELVDSPIECGNPTEFTITPMGIPHRILLCGKGSNYEPHRLQEDLGKIAEATTRLFGDSPLRHYTFFYHLTERPDGGLEHATSFSGVVPRTAFRPESMYQRFLMLTAHEYVHLYIVKRIRPKPLVVPDLTREVYTHLLWAMEGSTDYFAGLVLRRGGLVTPSKFLSNYADVAKDYLRRPGRNEMDLEQASLSAWVEYYVPNEESPNRAISYYSKGSLVSLALDLEIRHRTENRSSLEAVFRELWSQFGRPDRGLEETDVLATVNRVTGTDLTDFFSRYVSGRVDLDLDAFARHAGLRFGAKDKPREPDEDEPAGELGVELRDARGLAQLATVYADGPARRAGLSPGDEIVALDSVRVRYDQFPKVLARYPAGTNVEVTVFRRGYLERFPLVTGKAPPEKYTFTPSPDATPLQRATYEAWVGAKWEPAEKGPSTT